MSEKLDFFAAANSSEGFVSFFEQMYDKESVVNARLIFGGPGTGKSTLMRTVERRLEREGYSQELIHCSSDPGSLDGIYCGETKNLILDATPPHTVTPKMAGVLESVVNIGDCWDADVLKKYREGILECDTDIKALYAKVYAELKKAAAGADAAAFLGRRRLDVSKVVKYCARLEKAVFTRKSVRKAEVRVRVLSGITPVGRVFYYDTVNKLTDKIYLIDDREYAAADMILDSLLSRCVKLGMDCYACYCPLVPTRLEHILIPGLRVAVVAGSGCGEDREKLKNVTLIRARRFYTANSKAMRFLNGVYHDMKNRCVDAAVKDLAKIKERHDDLEGFYRLAMDYDMLTALAEKTAEEFLMY